MNSSLVDSELLHSNYDDVEESQHVDVEEQFSEDPVEHKFSEEPYFCRLCDKSFSSRESLNVHYTHTHRDKPQYECHDCGLIFTVKRELATHRRIHSGGPLHTCLQCGKVFGTKQLLKKHHLWHTGQRTHVCPQCGKAFYQKGHLTQHLMIHTGGRPHVCRLCKKTFVFKFDLNRHLKIHAERGHMMNETDVGVAIPVTPQTPVDHNIFDSSSYSGSSPTADSNSPPLDPNGQYFPPGTYSRAPGNMTLADWLAIRAAYQASLKQQIGLNLINSTCVAMASAAANDSVTNTTESLDNPALIIKEELNNVKLPSVENNSVAADEADKIRVKQEDTAFNCDDKDSDASEISGQPEDCDRCGFYLKELMESNKRVSQLEERLQSRDSELKVVKTKMNKVGHLAGSLLESCSDFDKLWMLHSKKVYSHIQTVLSTLE